MRQKDEERVKFFGYTYGFLIYWITLWLFLRETPGLTQPVKFRGIAAETAGNEYPLKNSPESECNFTCGAICPRSLLESLLAPILQCPFVHNNFVRTCWANPLLNLRIETHFDHQSLFLNRESLNDVLYFDNHFQPPIFCLFTFVSKSSARENFSKRTATINDNKRFWQRNHSFFRFE